tara:strand:- start:3783 stop:4100 length:318 start_codon:yes stop_codon:yes gene_type:complete
MKIITLVTILIMGAISASLADYYPNPSTCYSLEDAMAGFNYIPNKTLKDVPEEIIAYIIRTEGIPEDLNYKIVSAPSLDTSLIMGFNSEGCWVYKTEIAGADRLN